MAQISNITTKYKITKSKAEVGCAHNTSKIKNAQWELNTYIKKLIWNIFDLKLLLSKGLQRNVIHTALQLQQSYAELKKFMLYAKFDLKLHM